MDYAEGPMEVLSGGAVSYERGASAEGVGEGFERGADPKDLNMAVLDIIVPWKVTRFKVQGSSVPGHERLQQLGATVVSARDTSSCFVTPKSATTHTSRGVTSEWCRVQGVGIRRLWGS